MVPTEEERLPVRISISVRGLSFWRGTLQCSPLFASLCHIRSSYICIAMVMLHAGLKPERTLVLSQTILLIEFPYCVRHLLCTFLARYWLAVSVVRHGGYTIINSITVHLVDCGEHRV